MIVLLIIHGISCILCIVRYCWFYYDFDEYERRCEIWGVVPIVNTWMAINGVIWIIQDLYDD